MFEQTEAQAATFRAIDDHFEPLRIGKIEAKWANLRWDVGTGTLVSTYISDSACFFVAVDDTGQLVSVEGPSLDSAAGGPRESLWDEPIGREFRHAASQLNTPCTHEGTTDD